MNSHIEQDQRQEELERLYTEDGRHDKAHPMHALYTGLINHPTTQEKTDDSE